MKLKALLWIGAALVTVPFASGCGYDCTVMGCFAGIEVALVPSVSSTYDVELVLDGVVDAFTCIKTEDGWSVGDSTEGVLSFGCDGFGFRLDATPETLGISVAAQDGSWTGSISESPDYRFYQPNGAKCDGAYGCDQAELTVPKG
jgi:hypothetical protein